MQYVYVMFSKTNTGMGKIIRVLTNRTYNHVSISLQEKLCPTYSFARRKKYNVLAGGFIQESGERLCDGGDIQIKICRVPVSEARYERVQRILEFCEQHPNLMIYNSFAALGSLLRRNLSIPFSFTCVGFVSWCLGEECPCIAPFEKMLSGCEIYEGSYLAWVGEPSKEEGDYFRPVSLWELISSNLRHFGDLIGRIICAGLKRADI